MSFSEDDITFVICVQAQVLRPADNYLLCMCIHSRHNSLLTCVLNRVAIDRPFDQHRTILFAVLLVYAVGSPALPPLVVLLVLSCAACSRTWVGLLLRPDSWSSFPSFLSLDSSICRGFYQHILIMETKWPLCSCDCACWKACL